MSTDLRREKAAKRLADTGRALVEEIDAAVSGDHPYSGGGPASKWRAHAEALVAEYEEAVIEARHLGIVP